MQNCDRKIILQLWAFYLTASAPDEWRDAAGVGDKEDVVIELDVAESAILMAWFGIRHQFTV